MKKILVLTVMFLCGCEHYTISDNTYLQPIESSIVKKQGMKSFPMNLKASMDCRTDGNMKRCSNEMRIKRVVNILNERGYGPLPAGEGVSAPSVVVEVDDLNGVLTYLSGVVNFLTLGFVPRYDYKKYTVTYVDQENAIDISEEVKIGIYAGWIPLFMDNPENLDLNEMNKRAEWNVINSVFNKANLVKKESVTAN